MKKKKRRRMTKHHIKNKIDGGDSSKENIYYMSVAKHQAFHLLFHNLTFREAGELLLRIDKNRTIKDYLGV